MKRILLLGNCHFTIVRFRKELIIKLVELGYDVWISFPNFSQGEKESGEDAAKRLGCNFLEFKMLRRSATVLKELNTINECRRLIKEISPDVILTYTIKPNIYGGLVAHRFGIPYFMNVTGLGSGFNKGDALSKILIKLMKFCMNRAENVFFQNEENIDFFKSAGYTKNNYELIPGSGVNLEEFKPLPYKKEGFYFLYLARVMKEKGIDEFLALANDFKDNHSVEFHVCGDMEEDYDEIIRDYAARSIIQYHGTVENVVDYLAMASAVIHPSYYNEGISNTLLEAAASARPIITTNHPGCREVVIDGKTGFLFEKQNIEDLRKKVKKFILLSVDERKNMGIEGRRLVEEKYNRKQVVDKYLEYISI
ncbi:glycosyltransferase family 4 protein [Butyrivibrio sp. FCS006]|uniref:glycosyltransferase family 4 protein n=1 Tax=Butyrivibrio sp. FCS006 TaxID=1280684 RepID=UPI000411462F|nr:glycosyltransferase family 4 protein [Butyrivibrio sp. FCS006]